ncbi:LINE-1 retrotransposable element ORF1 protein [Plecturocebus cupreus]
MGRNQSKQDENIQKQNASPPPRDHNSSPAREQGWMENRSEELTETGFRKWVINFAELKDHVLTQCKETKNLEKRFDEMLMRINSLERNINDGPEKHNMRTLRSIHKFQAEERILQIEDQLNEIKREGKIREKRVKINEQSLQEMWNYVKRPNLGLIGVPECEGENESKLENTL